jgi:adenosylcobyric acid synthase
MSARCIMVLGTSSGAGKSWVATALCAWYRAQGYKVAPFKAQNMSNNARVVATPDGQWGEIGTAQYLQALAAGAVPDVRMNPLLLKPEADTRSQVVLFGQVDEALSKMPWRGRSLKVWPQIAQALDALRAENDVVVIEGAGSPAEINLHSSDVVNMRVARHCDAHCLLVSDIDRGGAFAHLYGTWALLPPEEQGLIKGFVLNKFRGDAALLAPAPQMLQDKTGVPTVACIPMQFQHGLPEEDGVFDDRGSGGQGQAVHTCIAIVAYPRISNLDEFQPLLQLPGVRVVWARTPAQLSDADWVILPGSKATAADLAWMRQQGLDAAVARHAQAGKLVVAHQRRKIVLALFVQRRAYAYAQLVFPLIHKRVGDVHLVLDEHVRGFAHRFAVDIDRGKIV